MFNMHRHAIEQTQIMLHNESNPEGTTACTRALGPIDPSGTREGCPRWMLETFTTCHIRGLEEVLKSYLRLPVHKQKFTKF